jgi:thiamine-phosphate pyrophosphorylase
MNSKRKLLKESRLYVIVDKTSLANKPILNTIRRIKNSAADIIQLRDRMSNKDTILNIALAIKKLLFHKKPLFIINDHLDIAKIVDSDGIHLGQDDLPIQIARKILGKEKIIGISCHNLAQAIIAQNNGADYISIGPIFATPTKPEYKPVGLNLINKVSKKIKIPFFVIGGINEDNLGKVLSFGAGRIALCRPICKSNNIKYSISKIKKLLH